jgi:hypothetical protein
MSATLATAATSVSPAYATESQAAKAKTWTIAWRKPRANRFQRATNWAGTWAEAFEMAQAFGELHPDLQVYYTTSLEHEQAQAAELPRRVAAGEISQELADSYLEDHGNILVDSGKRVRIVDNGVIEQALLDAEINDVAAFMHRHSHTVPGFRTLADCRAWARNVRVVNSKTFAEMVTIAGTAQDRFAKRAER